MNKSMSELQYSLLNMIKEIDYLCKNNDIQYYLIAGSALGAIRHKGFIPWDDDLDIAMTRKNYSRFIEVSKEKLDSNKYFVQEEKSEKWPMLYSKIRLNNSIFDEDEMEIETHKGIFIDVFPLDNASNYVLIRSWQYILSKFLIADSLKKRGYRSAGLLKASFMTISSKMLSYTSVRYFIEEQVFKYNNKQTNFVALFFGRTRLNNVFIESEVLGNGKHVNFEGIRLPVPAKVEVYLKKIFGDYMTLPPKEMRTGHNPIEIKIKE